MGNRTQCCDIHPVHDMSDNAFIADPRFDKDRYVFTAPLSDDDVDALFPKIAQATVDEDPGLIGWMRQCSTPLRVLMCGAVGVSLSGAVVAMVGLRSDLAAEGRAGMLLALGAMIGLGVGSTGLSLRGLHLRTRDGVAWLFASLVLLFPLVISLLLGQWAEAPSIYRVMPWLSGCFLLGVAVAALSGAAVLLLQRSRELLLWRVLAAAGAGGSAGFTTQSLFCPASDPWHLITAHGLVTIWTALALLIVQQVWQRL